jgi:hypothetical protein
MNKSFKIQKVKRVLRLSTTNFEPANYIVYKVSGPRKLVKYFGFKKDAETWVKSYTAQKPMTSDQMYDFYKGR